MRRELIFLMAGLVAMICLSSCGNNADTPTKMRISEDDVFIEGDGEMPIGPTFDGSNDDVGYNDNDSDDDIGEDGGNGNDGSYSNFSNKRRKTQTIRLSRIITTRLKDGLFGEEYLQRLASICSSEDSCQLEAHGLPKGLSLKSEKGHIGRIEGVPEEMGTFPIRITLTDRNTNKTVEQTLDLRVKDDIAVHTYKDGDDDWNTISSSSAIILSKKGKKTVFIGVQGNAPNYTWSISGDSRVKLDKNCMDKDTPEYKEYSCLVTDYEGAEIITVEDLVVVIDDGLGNREELEFTNVVLEQDMCKTPMTVKASKVKVPYGHYSISFKIEGGMPPYHYFKYDPVTDMEYGVNDFSDSEINISDDANLVPGADLEYAMNADEAIHYNFYDSCGTYTYDNSITTELGLFFQDETLLFKSYYFKSELVITADDTDGDGDSPMYMALLNKDNDVMAKWASGNDELSINLDIYNKDHGNGQYWKVVDQPHTKFSNNQTRVTDIDRVQFRVSSHGNDLFEEVDIAFQRYIIKLPNWCGTAQNMPTGEYECTNNIFCSYHYPISWRIRDGAEDDCSGDYIFRNYVETKT